MNREDLCNIAQDTIQISKNRGYNFNGIMIPLGKLGNVKYISPEKSEKLHSIMVQEPLDLQREANIFVNNEATVDRIFQISKSNKEAVIGVMNFASAYNVGGGFETGAMAQEEALAYCSDLAELQRTPEGFKYYEYNKEQNSAYYTDGLIVSETVFFKDSQFNLVGRPVKVIVVTIPAVNLNAVKSRNADMSCVKNIMKWRMIYTLNIMQHFNVTDAVLGAFGCGVFGNSPKDIAEIWDTLLNDAQYIRSFDNIYFSVLDFTKDLKNFKEFQFLTNRK